MFVGTKKVLAGRGWAHESGWKGCRSRFARWSESPKTISGGRTSNSSSNNTKSEHKWRSIRKPVAIQKNKTKMKTGDKQEAPGTCCTVFLNVWKMSEKIFWFRDTWYC